MKRSLSALVAMSFALAACVSNQQPAQTMSTKQAIGAALGGAAGAAIGSQMGDGAGKTTAIAAGTLLGAALGAQIGAYLDQMDMMYHEQTAQHALETAKSGTTLAWNNPDSGNSGSVTPVNVIQRDSGTYCREYRQQVMAGNDSQRSTATACRQPDGSWKISN